MVRTVLLAYNGTREGRAGLLEFVHVIAPGPDIHLLAVATMPAGAFLAEGFVPGTYLEEEERRYREIVDEGVRMLAERGYRATPHLASGEPVEEIVAAARTLKAELIVVGHHRRTSMAERWWRGSVGASLIEVAPCSVLIAIEPDEKAA